MNPQFLFNQSIAAARLIPDPFDQATELVAIGEDMADSGSDPSQVLNEAIMLLNAQPASPVRDWTILMVQQAQQDAWGRCHRAAAAQATQAAQAAAQATAQAAQAAVPPQRHPLIQKMVGAGKLTVWIAVIALSMFVIGWVVASTKIGLVFMVVGGVALLVITGFWLLPIEWATSIGDILFGKRNQLDDKARSLRITLGMTIAFFMLCGFLAHLAKFTWSSNVLLFGLMVALTVGAAANLQKALAFETLRRSHHVTGVALAGISAVIIAFWVVCALKVGFKDDPEAISVINGMVLAGLCLLAIAATIALALYVFKFIYRKMDDSGHGGLLAGVLAVAASILIMFFGIKGALVLGTPTILDKVAVVLDKVITIQKNENDAKASDTAGTATDSSASGDKQSELNQKALDALNGSAAPQPADKQAEAAGKPRTLEQVQKLLAVAEEIKRLEKEIESIGKTVGNLERSKEEETDPVKFTKIEDQYQSLIERQRLFADDLAKARGKLPADVDLKGFDAAAYAKQLRDELKALQGTQQKPSPPVAEKPTGKGNGGGTKAKDEDKPQVASSDSLSVEAYCKGLPNKFRVGKCEKYKG